MTKFKIAENFEKMRLNLINVFLTLKLATIICFNINGPMDLSVKNAATIDTGSAHVIFIFAPSVNTHIR